MSGGGRRGGGGRSRAVRHALATLHADERGFIIIWGNKYVFKRVAGGWTGELHCPQCAAPRVFVEKQPVKYFTLYWIPLFPTSREAPFIECTTCGGKFDKPAQSELPSGGSI